MSAQPVRNTFRSLSDLGLDGTGCIAGRHNAPVQSELMGQERRAAVAAAAACLCVPGGRRLCRAFRHVKE